jgi:hypothetical protein
MPEQDKNLSLLRSWKDISAYLKCDIRTCCRWEQKNGLPIHRINNSCKSSVFAYKAELDRWLNARPKSSSSSFSFKSINRKLLFFLIAITVFLILVIVAYVFIQKNSAESPSPPVHSSGGISDFGIEDSSLVIKDKNGRELWRFETGLEDLCEESVYRSHFQSKRLSPEDNPIQPFLIIKDINEDNRKEVLFSLQTHTEYQEGVLYCFDSQGRLLWNFSAGRQMQYGSDIYSSDYRIVGFDVQDLDGDKNLEIIVISIHKPFFPSQLTVLDNLGRVRGEFWNSGHLSDFTCVDLDNNGRKEIIATGFNNEYRQGCLAIFDSMRIGGSSPQSIDKYICPGLKSGAESFYARFPQPFEYNKLVEKDTLESVSVLKNDMFSVRSWPSGLYFNFNFRLEFSGIISSDIFRNIFQHQTGLIEVVSEEIYLKNLEEKIVVYEHNKWIPIGRARSNKDKL